MIFESAFLIVRRMTPSIIHKKSYYLPVGVQYDRKAAEFLSSGDSGLVSYVEMPSDNAWAIYDKKFYKYVDEH
jgi:hypothetical protein